MTDYPAYQMPPAGFFKLDPRTKVILMFVLAILLAYEHEDLVFVSATVFICWVLLLTNRQFKPALIWGGLFLLAIPAKLFQNQHILPQIVEIAGVLYSALVMRLLPTFMLGYYLIDSTSASEFTSAMQKWHVSKKLLIPILVVFRFLPTIAEESRSISVAMKMREINFGSSRFRNNPGILLEYRLIPLMISTVKIGEELSAAALTKGLDSESERTSIARIGFGFYDVIVLAALAAMILWKAI